MTPALVLPSIPLQQSAGACPLPDLPIDSRINFHFTPKLARMAQMVHYLLHTSSLMHLTVARRASYGCGALGHKGGQ